MTDGDNADIPHPEECNHKWILKGGADRAGMALYQCEKCGRARSQRIKRGDRVIHEGWNPKPDSEDDGDNGGWFGL